MLLFLDIETTGMDPSRDHIIEIACVKWKNGEIVERYESLVNPRIPLPYVITQLTGITDTDVKNAPLFSEIQEKLFAFINDLPIVGHNIAFDSSFLKFHHAHLKNPEIDTISLARILLLRESSYALEVLMKKYGLPLRESHRAMADVETTISFFEFLLGRINEIPEETMKKIQDVLEKSFWAGKEVFSKNSAKAMCTIFPVSSPPPRMTKHDMPTPTASLAAQFFSGNKILLESSAKIPFAEIKKELKTPIVIAYASERKRNELMEGAKNAGLTVCNLKEPQFYLSPKKINEKLAEKALSPEETPFLLKMILWNSETEAGDREEISLDRGEYGYFDLYADHEGNDVFWQKSLAAVQNTDVVLIHQYALARGLASLLQTSMSLRASASERSNLIITEASRLEESFTNAFKKRLSEAELRPFFGEKATLLFGFIGIFYERFVEPDYAGFRGSVIVNDMARASLEWKRVLDATENLPNRKRASPAACDERSLSWKQDACRRDERSFPSKKQELQEAFAARENTLQWITSIENEISFSSAPIVLSDLFHKSIAPFSNVLLQSDALSGEGNFGLVRELFELDSEWKEIKPSALYPLPSTLTIKFPENFPEPYSGGYFKKCVKLFIELITEKRGRILFILSSKKAVAAMYNELLPKIKPLNTKLLAVGASGGTGKSVALFKENPSSTVLFATNQIIPYLEEIENLIEIVVFQKIPFDPPSDPLLSSRAAQFENGFEQYTLPRAITRFRELLIELGKSGQKICYLLDSRLKTRDYGRLFI